MICVPCSLACIIFIIQPFLLPCSGQHSAGTRTMRGLPRPHGRSPGRAGFGFGGGRTGTGWAPNPWGAHHHPGVCPSPPPPSPLSSDSSRGEAGNGHSTRHPRAVCFSSHLLPCIYPPTGVEVWQCHAWAGHWGGGHEGEPKGTGRLLQERGARLPHQLSHLPAPGGRAALVRMLISLCPMLRAGFRASNPIPNHQQLKTDGQRQIECKHMYLQTSL